MISQQAKENYRAYNRAYKQRPEVKERARMQSKSTKRIPLRVPFPDMDGFAGPRIIDPATIAAGVKPISRDVVFVRDVAKYLGISYESLRKYVKRRKFETAHLMEPKSRQKSMALSPEDAQRLLQTRADEGYPTPGRTR